MSDDELVTDAFDDAFDGVGEDAEVADVDGDDLDDELAGDDDLDSFDDDTEAVGDSAAVLDAAEDGDDEDAGEPAVDLAAIDGLDEVGVDDEDDDDEDDDGLRPDEFVCRSCHMARRGSALADPDAMLCRDCV